MLTGSATRELEKLKEALANAATEAEANAFEDRANAGEEKISTHQETSRNLARALQMQRRLIRKFGSKKK